MYFVKISLDYKCKDGRLENVEELKKPGMLIFNFKEHDPLEDLHIESISNKSSKNTLPIGKKLIEYISNKVFRVKIPKWNLLLLHYWFFKSLFIL